MKFDTVKKFLNYGIFTIPEYQRGYSWTKEQLDDLANDLNDVEYVKEHYTGTITLIQTGQERIGITMHTKYNIVDGQQRLTTFHLLIISLYYRLKELDINSADEKIIENVLYRGKTFLKLNNNKDQGFFFDILNEGNNDIIRQFQPTTKTQRNLLDARLYFDVFFSKYKSIPRIIKMYNNLFSKFKVNITELEDESEVGLIFETMNNRGLQLSDIDKVKNYLIYLSHKLNEKKLAKDINKSFGEIFSELMKIENHSVTQIENQFLKDCYVVYTGDNKALKDIHKKIKTNLIPQKSIFKNKTLFDNNENLKNKKIKEIRDFNNYLHRCAFHYAKIYNRSFNNEDISNSLLRLSALDKTETFIPLLLAVLNSRFYKEEFLIPIIEIMESFALRVFVFGNKNRNMGHNKIIEFSYNVFRKKLKFNDLKTNLRTLVNSNSNTTELRRSILNINSYDSLSTKAFNLIFYYYELYLQKQAVNKFEIGNLFEFINDKKITIEHIAPQQALSNEKSVKDIDVLGNLVITKTNSTLSNKNFQSKKLIYQHSNFASERELITYEVWNDKTIRERGKKLAKFILDKWKV